MSDSPSPAASSPAPPRPRRAFYRRPAGILALVLFVLVLLLALAPTLGAGFAKGRASAWFEDRYRGKLVIRELDLGWTGRQRIEDAELQDPDGARVARISAELPGLWAMLTSGGKRLGRLEVRGEAALVQGADGRTNLDRALEPREPETPREPEPAGDPGSAPLEDLEAELDVLISRLSWEDERTRALGAPFVLEDLALLANVRADAPLTAKVRGTFAGSGKGALEVDAKVENPFEPPSSSTPPKAEIAARVERLPVALLDALARQGGLVEALLGEELSLAVDARGTVQQGTCDLRIETPRANVRAAARLEDGVLRAHEGGVVARLELEQKFLELLARPHVGADAKLARIPRSAESPIDDELVHFDVPEFAVPLGAYLESSARGQADAAALALVQGTRARWSLQLGDWFFHDPAALGGRGPLLVRDLAAEGELKAPAEDSFVRCSLSASNASKEYADAEYSDPAAQADMAFGTLRLEATFRDPAALAGLASAAQPAPVRVRATVAELPTGVLDLAAGAGGKLVLVLGPRLAVDVDASAVLGAGPAVESGQATARIEGARARVEFAGRFQDGAFVQGDQPALRAVLQPDQRLLDELVLPRLPAGTTLAFGKERGELVLEVPVLSVPVDELLRAARAKDPDVVALALARTRCDAVLTLGELAYADEKLRAAGQRIERLAAKATLGLVPGAQATPLAAALELTSAAWPAPISVRADAPHAPELLGVAAGRPFAPLLVRASGKDLPSALLDAHAGGALAPAVGPRLELLLDARLAQPQGSGEPLAVDATLELGSEAGRSKLVLAARAKEPFAATRPAGVPPELTAMLDVEGAGLLLAFAPDGARDALRSLCGEKIAARVSLAGAGEDALHGELTLDAGAISAKGALDYAGGVARGAGAEPLFVRVAPAPATLDLLLAGKLPEGARLSLADQGGALELRVTRLEVPLGRRAEAADPAAANAELVAATTLALDARLPAFVYTHPAAAQGAAGTPVALRDIRLLAQLSPGKPATVDVQGDVDAKPPGTIAVAVVVENPAGFARTPVAPDARAKLDAKLAHFPSALLDVLARQDGLLVDVLGPELEAVVRGVYPDSGSEPLRAELHSALGDVVLESRLEDGVIVSKGEQGLDAKVGLTPLFSERIVGSLVPLLVDVRQADPAKRTLLQGRNLALPMDADLSKLSGDIVLDLGAVEYQLLPGLEQALQLAGSNAPGRQSTTVPAIVVKIVGGVARYDSIPLRIAGRDVEFRGSADLVQKTFVLGFEVPLEMLGSKVESELEKLRGVLDPNLAVPLEIYGSWKSPRVRLGKGFLEKALKDAATGALEGELEKGLGGLFGGKKKKKDG